MRFFSGASALLLALAPFVSAQGPSTVYEDPETGIIFDTWSAAQMTWGYAFPADAATVDATEYIGYLRCNTPGGEGVGWCGYSNGGGMLNRPLLTAYPWGDDVLTTFFWATGYESPVHYTGDAEVIQIRSSITAEYFELIFRCVNCLAWNQGGVTGSVSTSAGGMTMGWAWADESPANGECPATLVVDQHTTQSIFGSAFTSASKNALYADWVELATDVVPGNCDGGPPTTTTTVPGPTATPVPEGTSFDYIVIGAGAGGIPVADRLSEKGHSVLLIEKGPVSTGEHGGQRKPEWLSGTDLTRFDVPGLCNEIWADSSGIACQDTDQMAGCILGGGTAINAGLWWKPKDADWDYNFPNGWKSSDMKSPADRVFSRIPGTRRPSQDGERYLPQGYNIISQGLEAGGWSEVNPTEEPNAKFETYTDGNYMFSGGERGGPLATYLTSAKARSNFKLWTDTQVRKLVRTRGHVTSVVVESPSGRGYSGVVDLTAEKGRVVVSSGTFGSAKLLLRSGIGPTDQLQIVANSTSDGADFIDEADWIVLPVGYNLEDHTNTDTVVSHPDAVFYDFYEAFDDPIVEDAEAYLSDRAGILAQAAPNIGPVFFDEIKGADGVTRSLQWTARVEASLGHEDPNAITISQYLGRGAKSRGRMTITSSLNTVVSDVPYLKNADDEKAVIAGLDRLREILGKVEGLTFLSPAANQTSQEYVEEYLIATSTRRANHWIGTNKMGTNDGRQNNGDAVVDTNTKVWGTDNLFVVDASIFPGMVTPNPSAYIVTVAERAAERILALPTAVYGKLNDQCGGRTWNGSYTCQSGLTCVRVDSYYSQCRRS